MAQLGLGVMEIFFGPPWSEEARLRLAPFLKSCGYEIYLYGPKADPCLRKGWRADFDQTYIDGLKNLSRHFRGNGLKFSLAFSPFGAQEKLDSGDKELLRRKVGELDAVGLDLFGLFFDDMPSSAGLAERQLEIISLVREGTSAKILFCPSYYSPDPILDKVFGQRPPDYLDTIGREAPLDVEILWTGPKVISPEIPADHLRSVSETLRRKPVLCDNLYANDGPKNCKFLKLKACTGRSPEALAATNGWIFNPMNQAELSKILLLSSAQVMRGGQEPGKALSGAIERLCSPALADFLVPRIGCFLEEGLDKITDTDRRGWISDLSSFRDDPMASELKAWLEGAYTVGSECLTD